jgi:hypothetical protein
MFEVVEELPFGVLVRAKVDMLPGTLLFRETPLLKVPAQEYLKYEKDLPGGDTERIRKSIAAYFTFLKLPAEKQLIFLGLYGPTDNRYHKLKPFLESCELFKMDEIPLVIKVISIYTFNDFLIDSGDFIVYELLTRFSHSCYPNCDSSMELEVNAHPCESWR